MALIVRIHRRSIDGSDDNVQGMNEKRKNDSGSENQVQMCKINCGIKVKLGQHYGLKCW